MLSGYLLLAMAALPQNEPKINIDCTGKSVEAFLKEVNQQAKTNLSPSPQLKNEIIIASLKDDTVAELKDNLAAAVGGVWKETQSGPVLEIDTERAAREAAESKKELIEATTGGKELFLQNNPEVSWTQEYATSKVREDQEQVRKILESIRGNNNNSEDHLTIQAINSEDQSPATTFLRKIITNLSPDMLASLPAGKRVVYSTRPTAMQKPMPINTSGFENAFVNEMNILNKAIKDAPPVDPSVTFISTLNQSQAVSLPLGKVLLAVKRVPQSRGFNFELIISTPDGKIAAQAQNWVAEKWDPKPGSTTVPEGAYDPSPLAVKMAKALRTGQSSSSSIMSNRGNTGFEFVMMTTDQQPVPIDPAAYAVASDPVKNEPLSIMVSESIHQYAQAVKKDFIACVPDALVMELANKLSGDKMLWQQFSDTLDSAQTKVSVAGNTLVFTPKNAEKCRTNRVNRSAFAAFIKPLAASGYSRLIDSANYALAKTWEDSFDAPYTGIISNETFYQVFNSGRTDYLRLFGAMNRTTASRGPETQYPIIGQPPRAKDLLTSMLYNRGGSTIMGKGSMLMVSQGNGPRDRAPQPTLASEPTEIFPNGLPQNASINFNYGETACIFGRSKSTMQGKFFTAQNLAHYQMMKSGQDDQYIVGLDPSDQSIMYQEAQAASFDIRVPLAEGFELNNSLTDGWVTKPQAMTYNQLPAAFIAEVENFKKNSRNLPINIGGGRGQVKPPVR